MKRILLALLGVAMMMGLASSAMAAAGTLFWDITVAVGSDPIDLTRTSTDNGTFNWGTLGFNTENFSNLAQGNPRMTLSNNGFATIDYGVYVTATANNWGFNAPLTTGNGPDVAVLAGLFCEPLLTLAEAAGNPIYAHQLVIGDFVDADILNNTMKFADDVTPTVFVRSGADAQFLPYNVPSNLSTRNFRLYLLTPTAASVSKGAVLHIVIGARVAVIGG